MFHNIDGKSLLVNTTGLRGIYGCSEFDQVWSDPILP